MITFILIGYAILLLFWIFLIYSLKMFRHLDTVVGFLMLVPPIVAFINLISYNHTTPVSERRIFETDRMSEIVIVMSIVISLFLHDDDKEDQCAIGRYIIAAIAIAALASIDIWVPGIYSKAWEYIKTLAETIAIVLIILALYIYFFSKKSGNCPEM